MLPYPSYPSHLILPILSSTHPHKPFTLPTNAVVTRDRNLSVESIGSFDNRSMDGQGQSSSSINGQNPDLLNSIQQMRIRRLKMTTTTPGDIPYQHLSPI